MAKKITPAMLKKQVAAARRQASASASRRTAAKIEKNTGPVQRVGRSVDAGVAATKKFVKPAYEGGKKVFNGDLSGVRNLERKISTKVGKAYNQSLGFKGKNATVNKYVGRAVGGTGYMLGSTGVSLYKSYGDQKKEASGK